MGKIFRKGEKVFQNKMKEDLMVQQQVKNKWQHMVGVICLNQTYRKQVKEVLPRLFKRYPNAKAYLRGRLSTQQNMLKPLGMWSVRAKRLRQMSKEFLTWDGVEASDLHGIGKYGSDSYKIFYKNESGGAGKKGGHPPN